MLAETETLRAWRSNAMGGARLSTAGLHLGHFLGCVVPLVSLKAENSFFVIRDVERSTDGLHGASFGEIVEFAKDVLALDTPTPIRVVRQTFLLEHAPAFWRFLLSFVSLRHLLNAHPIRRDVKAGAMPDSSVANLLFPIDSIHSYFCLGASRVCMNDDNIRFVDLGARYAKKLAGTPLRELVPEPALVTGPVTRLIGQDHQKIAHSRQNAYYLRQGPTGCRRYMFNLFNKSSFFRRFPDQHEIYRQSPSTFVFPESFAPFSHLCLLLGLSHAREIWAGMTLDRFESTVNLLTSTGEQLLTSFSDRRKQLTDADTEQALGETELFLGERLRAIDAAARAVA